MQWLMISNRDTQLYIVILTVSVRLQTSLINIILVTKVENCTLKNTRLQGQAQNFAEGGAFSIILLQIEHLGCNFSKKLPLLATQAKF